MGRIQNKKKTVRFTEEQNNWINRHCEKHDISFQQMINEILYGRGMPVGTLNEKDDEEIEQLKLFDN